MNKVINIKYTLGADQKNFWPLWYNDFAGLSDRSFAYSFNDNYINPNFVLFSTKKSEHPYFIASYGNIQEESSAFLKLFNNKEWCVKIIDFLTEKNNKGGLLFKEIQHEVNEVGGVRNLNREKIYQFSKKIKDIIFEANNINQNTHPQCTDKIENELLSWIRSEAKISKYVKEHTDHGVFEILLKSPKLTKLNQLRFDLLKLFFVSVKQNETKNIGYLIKNNKKLKEDIGTLIDNGYIQAYSVDATKIDAEPLTLKQIINMYDKIRNDQKYKEKIRYEFDIFNSQLESLKTKEAILSSVDISPRILHIINVLSELSVLRLDTHTTAINLMYWVALFLNHLIQKDNKIKREELDIYTGDELLNYIKNATILPASELKNRDFTWAAVFNEQNIINAKILFGQEAREDEYVIKIHKDREELMRQELRGTIASKGKGKPKEIIGTAYVLNTSFLDINQIVNFPVDSILVVTQTLPNLLPIISKSKAIIADEGGLAGHAAIISREMGIPCIVGTRVATSVIKTGNFIRLDMESGNINIIDNPYV